MLNIYDPILRTGYVIGQYIITKNDRYIPKYFLLQDSVLELYHDVVLRYLRVGVGQFLWDFRKDYQLKKSRAHRKAVLQKNGESEREKR